MKVNILFPVLNEKRRLERGILKTLIYLTRNPLFDYQLTIVDNGSEDETEAIGRRLAKNHGPVVYLKTPRRGVGVALRTGAAENTCDVIGYMDIDLSTNLDHLKDVEAVFESRPDVQIIKGSRLLKGADVQGRKPLREFTSRALNTLLHMVFKNNFSDALCGFDFYRKETLDRLVSISSNDNGWFYCVELLLRAERECLSVYDIPVTWRDDYDSKVNVTNTVVAYLKRIHALKREFSKEDKNEGTGS